MDTERLWETKNKRRLNWAQGKDKMGNLPSETYTTPKILCKRCGKTANLALLCFKWDEGKNKINAKLMSRNQVESESDSNWLKVMWKYIVFRKCNILLNILQTHSFGKTNQQYRNKEMKIMY